MIKLWFQHFSITRGIKWLFTRDHWMKRGNFYLKYSFQTSKIKAHFCLGFHESIMKSKFYLRSYGKTVIFEELYSCWRHSEAKAHKQLKHAKFCTAPINNEKIFSFILVKITLTESLADFTQRFKKLIICHFPFVTYTQHQRYQSTIICIHLLTYLTADPLWRTYKLYPSQTHHCKIIRLELFNVSVKDR